MSSLIDADPGYPTVLMGNDAIARGALEAGLDVATGYPGTPSSEIVEQLARVAKQRNLYVEWSVNEKVATEVAAAASFAGLRALCVMKQNGVNVASDFLLHVSGTGCRGGFVLVACDDPGALSSVNEGESRHFAWLLEIPLLEPSDFQEAKEMTTWAFALSEELKSVVMIRSVTRMSHASGNVRLGNLPDRQRKAFFRFDGPFGNTEIGQVVDFPAAIRHKAQQEKIKKARELFERSPFNWYRGPEEPELLVITSSACRLYVQEAIHLLGVEDRVGFLKLGTTWPLPPGLIKKNLSRSRKVLLVEEVIAFLEDGVKAIAAEAAAEIGAKTFYGKSDGTIPANGELNPDLVVRAMSRILGLSYEAMPSDFADQLRAVTAGLVPPRDLAFCPGCPHRASFWNIDEALHLDNRTGFVCGDIGCLGIGHLPCAFNVSKIAHAMGSGTGLASGFGKLQPFGMDQPSIAICGDSTFFHSVMPALVNAVHHRARLNLIVLDNGGTAMTGFQSHPGLAVDAMGQTAIALDIGKICEAMGAEVEVADPFEQKATRRKINEMVEKDGVQVLILRQMCALSPEKRRHKPYRMSIDFATCLGDACGCNRLCTRVLRCPGMVWDSATRKPRVDEVLCAGCGFCAEICPTSAIVKEKVAVE